MEGPHVIGILVVTVFLLESLRKNPRCESDTCRNGGTCNVVDKSLRCSCTKGWRGSACEYPVCQSDTCKNNGRCTAGENGFVCECSYGWTGPTCEVPDCTPTTCKNGGTCNLVENQLYCSCSYGWTGPTCEDVKCESDSCINDGVCVVQENKISCRCNSEWTGKYCQNAVCAPDSCNKKGICEVKENRISCTCSPGWMGVRCKENSYSFFTKCLAIIFWLCVAVIYTFYYISKKKEYKEKEVLMKDLQNTIAHLEKPKNVLLVGELGVGKSSFINSIIAAVTGKYQFYADVGKGSKHVTISLQRISPEMYLDKTQFTECLNFPSFIDVIGFDSQLSVGNDGETTNSQLLDLIIEGKLPEGCDLIHVGKNLHEGRKVTNPKEDQSLQVDIIIVVVSARKSAVPDTLLDEISREARRKGKTIPVFGVLTFADEVGRRELEQMKKRICSNLSIGDHKFLACENYHHGQKISITKDLQLLRFLKMLSSPLFVRKELLEMESYPLVSVNPARVADDQITSSSDSYPTTATSECHPTTTTSECHPTTTTSKNYPTTMTSKRNYPTTTIADNYPTTLDRFVNNYFMDLNESFFTILIPLCFVLVAYILYLILERVRKTMSNAEVL